MSGNTRCYSTFIYVSLCILLWSLAPTFAKFAQNTLDNHQYLFYSSLISFLTLFIVTIFQGNLKELRTYSLKTNSIVFTLGVLNSLYYLLLYYGYKETNGLEVLVIQYLWPVFIVLLSIPILKEKLTVTTIISTLLGFSGVIMIVTKGRLSDINLSNTRILLTVMLGTLCFALFSVLGKKITINPINAVMLYFLSGTIFTFFTMLKSSSFIIPASEDWLSILVNGIFINGVSYIFWIKSLQNANASRLAPYIFITPVFSAIFLIFVFHEPILPIYLIGILTVIFSGITNSIKFRSRR